jgi:hypothetical protein
MILRIIDQIIQLKEVILILDGYMLEYIKIVELILSENKFYLAPTNNIAFEKDYIEHLLNRNTKFRDSKNKLKMWKTFNWIITEEKRLTSKVTIDGKRRHVIVFNIKSFKLLQEIQEESN